MIPYELLIASASRGDLLAVTLETFFKYADQFPGRVIINDDVVVPDRSQVVNDVIETYIPSGIAVYRQASVPPLFHGPAVHWLLSQASTEYVYYLQDDWETLRRLPISTALSVMDRYGLHQVRFNKRDTMGAKGEAPNRWSKKEVQFDDVVLTLTNAWYFNPGLWRVARIKPVFDWWELMFPGSIREHAEGKINDTLKGSYPDFSRLKLIDMALPEMNLDHETRMRVHRTYIWGPIGERQFVFHLGWKKEDSRLARRRDYSSEEAGPSARAEPEVL